MVQSLLHSSPVVTEFKKEEKNRGKEGVEENRVDWNYPCRLPVGYVWYRKDYQGLLVWIVTFPKQQSLLGSDVVLSMTSDLAL